MQERLRNLKVDDPEFWRELTQADSRSHEITKNLLAPDEDEIDGGKALGDDSNLPCSAIIARVLGIELSGIVAGPDGSLTSIAEAEGPNFEEEPVHAEGEDDGAAAMVQSKDVDRAEGSKEVLGRGRRKRQRNMLYSQTFWHHHDDSD